MIPRSVGLVLLVLCSVATGAVAFSDAGPLGDGGDGPVFPNGAPSDDGNEPLRLTTADSDRAFRAYLHRARRASGGSQLGGTVRATGGIEFDGGGARATATEAAAAGTADAAMGGDDGGASTAPERRVGGTNVQVTGVDEPDVVKTVGDRFYVAEPRSRFDDGGTTVVAATPPRDARVTASIDRSGRMLVGGDRVVVLPNRRVGPVEPVVVDEPRTTTPSTAGPKPPSASRRARSLTGYDVSAPDDPTAVWNRTVGGRVVAARMVDGQVLLVVVNELPRPDEPCRVTPLDDEPVPCTAIRHPDRPVPAEVTYSVLSVDAASGEATQRTTFVGGHDATVYVSPDAVYATYTTSERGAALRTAFLLDSERVPEHVKSRLRTVQGYELSPGAERAEVRATVQRWLASLPAEEQRETRERLREDWRDYLRDHRRETTTTHVVRFPVDDLDETTTGEVPGQVLNQFSFDVHDGHLRMATTVGERLPGVESANDVYVLDAASLEREGSVTGMSEGQRVYGVRFVGDRGYVVTFRQVDPLHVLDLSDPSNPEETGSVKLPGFSSYLHPLGDDRVLGIGEEDGRVKAVVFDVSDPTDPRVEESRVLDARWSAVSRTHHAFTYDPRHDVAFVPTPAGGYVLSTDDLATEARVDVRDPRRARYVGDHLFVFGSDRAVVLDETDWSRTTTVRLDDDTGER